MRRAAAFLGPLAAIALTAALLGGTAQADLSPTGADKFATEARALVDALQPGQMASVIVRLRTQANLSQIRGTDRDSHIGAVINALQNHATVNQAAVRGLLQVRRGLGRVASVTPFWIFNGLEVTATADVIRELAALPEVASITPNSTISAPIATPAAAAQPNLSAINAPAMWSLGYTGQGVVVANMDTGVDVTHPDLANTWRGGADSWYDPNGQHPTTPTDLSGHGSMAMGVMVGGSASGTAIGVAPGAKWIAVKIFNDQGTASISVIHQGFQWLLDPSGNPAAPDTPNVVSNSWNFGTVGCSLEFQPDLQSLQAVGTLPVFSGGNYGPNASTSVSPANNPQAFAVGATDNNDAIASFSSRGPATCGVAAPALYPAVTGPGVGVYTSDLYQSWSTVSGTSFSAPHAAGALALLLSAFPNLSVTQQQNALQYTARDLGAIGPDNMYGFGRIDAIAAYNWLVSGGVPPTPTVTPAPVSPTVTPVPPTSTPTPVPPPTATPTSTATATSVVPTATPTAAPNAIFGDGFESGNFSAWTSATGGNISVTSAARIGGNYGMQATLRGATAGWVTDGSPNNESSYHARFYFSPNSSNTTNYTTDIFVGHSSGGMILFRIQYRKNAYGQYQVRSSVRRADGSEAYTAWFTITNSAHPLEIAWQSGRNTSYSLSIDGSIVQTLIGQNTSAFVLREVLLGPSAGMPSSASGTEYFDSFASTRWTVIGP